MKIENGKVVSVFYDMFLDGFDSEIVESAKSDNPHIFLFGSGEMLPSFEKGIEGMQKGDSFEFMIKAADAFGEHKPEAVVEIPKEQFEVDGKFDSGVIFEGNIVPMKDQEGNQYEATILGVGPKNVRIDFNHPLAGEDLYIKGGVDLVREATADELEHGHTHKDDCGCCH
jgi:FKBP-type peptidyl-prolyl cis-trans isomerase SlyD